MTAPSLLPLELKCFGPPTVRVGGAEPPPDVLWRKNIAVLAYLALSPDHTRSREHLLGLLWPEKEEAKARHSLNEAIRRLRHGLGAGRLLSQGDAVTLDPDGVTADAWADDPPAEEFLDGLVIADAPEFETWLSEMRVIYRRRAVSRLVRDGERAVARLDFATARDHAHHALVLDPVHEPAARLMLRATALAGDGAGALRVFRSFTQTLADELDETPGRDLEGLAERIRAGGWRPPDATEPGDEPPLVGREDLHTQVFTEVRRAFERGPRVLAISGQPGMGRSRLLRECAARWRLEGGIVAAARPVSGDAGTPWSAVRQLMRGGLLDAPGLAGTEPSALRTLAAVVPRLAERFEPLEGMGQADVATALGEMLGAVAEEHPVALTVDDAHLADSPSLAALRHALDGAAEQPVLLILTFTEGAPVPDALTGVLSQVGRGLPGAAVRLSGLHDREIRQLVDAMAPWCTGDAQRDRLSRRITFETGGDPIFAVTLLSGLADMASLREDALVWPPPNITLEAPVPFEVPHLVRVVTLARIQRLPDTARTTLLAACAGPGETDPAVVASVTGLTDAEVERALAELERQRFLRFDGERYAVAAKLIADVVLTQLMTPGERRRLETRVKDARG